MSDNFHIKVKPEVLVWARESLAISKVKVCDDMDISLSRLEQIERGLKAPSLHELKLFSKVYKRTIATLLLNKPPKEKPLPKDRRTVNSDDIGVFHEKTILSVRKARALVMALMQLKEENNEELVKFSYHAEFSENPIDVARRIRNELSLSEVRDIENPNQALEAYIEKIESLGVAIFQLSLTQDRLRGFSIVDDAMPIIAIKRGGEQTTSKIFTLFHEFGHILLNEGGLCDISLSLSVQGIEKWCNAFAAEMIAPTEELLGLELVKTYSRNSQKEWLKKDLVSIGSEFHMGPLALLRRLLELNLTTREFYKEKHNAWSQSKSFGITKNPEGRNYAREALKERGRGFVSLAFKAYEQNKIDLKDLSDFLGVKLSRIAKTRELLYT